MWLQLIIEALGLAIFDSGPPPETVIKSDVTFSDVTRYVTEEEKPYSRLETVQKLLVFLPILLILAFLFSKGRLLVPALIILAACVLTEILIVVRIRKRAEAVSSAMTPGLRKLILEKKLTEAYNRLPITLVKDDPDTVMMRQKLREALQNGELPSVLQGEHASDLFRETGGIVGIVAAEMSGRRDRTISEISYLMTLPGRYTSGEKLKLICTVGGRCTILPAVVYDDGRILVTLYRKPIEFLYGKQFCIIIAREEGYPGDHCDPEPVN